jgi:hypothetical protein
MATKAVMLTEDELQIIRAGLYCIRDMDLSGGSEEQLVEVDMIRDILAKLGGNDD